MTLKWIQMKNSLILFFIFLPSFVLAKPCATYKIQGFVKVIENSFFIIINEKTKSEIQLSTKMELEPKLIAYENRPVISTVNIELPMNGTKGMIIEISKIELSLPDSILQPNKNNFDFKMKTECKE
jgi:hypothetical protein